MDGNSGAYREQRARYYDEQVQQTDRMDIAFYVDQATAVDGPILELACGTGRVYLELLRQGIDVDGVDISAAALAVLREKADEMGLDPTVRRMDMSSFEVEREYDLLVCPFNAVQHLLTVEDQLSALRSAHDALAPGGEFVFDVFVPGFDVVCETYGEWSTREVEYRGEAHEHRSRTRVVDEVEQQFLVETELRNAAGEEVFTASDRLKMLPKREVELLARLSPFDEWRVRGDFGDEPLRNGDSVQVWSLEKSAKEGRGTIQ